MPIKNDMQCSKPAAHNVNAWPIKTNDILDRKREVASGPDYNLSAEMAYANENVSNGEAAQQQREIVLGSDYDLSAKMAHASKKTSDKESEPSAAILLLNQNEPKREIVSGFDSDLSAEMAHASQEASGKKEKQKQREIVLGSNCNLSAKMAHASESAPNEESAPNPIVTISELAAAIVFEAGKDMANAATPILFIDKEPANDIFNRSKSKSSKLQGSEQSEDPAALGGPIIAAPNPYVKP